MTNTKTPGYTSWKTMRQRCNNPNNTNYHHYGGRGITICDRWDSFANFIEDMGERPEGLTLERRNTNGNYNPTNCYWATQSQQITNRRCTYHDKSHCPLSYIQTDTRGLSPRYFVKVQLTKAKRVIKAFKSLTDAINYRNGLLYERDFYKCYGLG